MEIIVNGSLHGDEHFMHIIAFSQHLNKYYQFKRNSLYQSFIPQSCQHLQASVTGKREENSRGWWAWTCQSCPYSYTGTEMPHICVPLHYWHNTSFSFLCESHLKKVFTLASSGLHMYRVYTSSQWSKLHCPAPWS